MVNLTQVSLPSTVESSLTSSDGVHFSNAFHGYNMYSPTGVSHYTSGVPHYTSVVTTRQGNSSTSSPTSSQDRPPSTLTFEFEGPRYNPSTVSEKMAVQRLTSSMSSSGKTISSGSVGGGSLRSESDVSRASTEPQSPDSCHAGSVTPTGNKPDLPPKPKASSYKPAASHSMPDAIRIKVGCVLQINLLKFLELKTVEHGKITLIFEVCLDNSDSFWSFIVKQFLCLIIVFFQ